MLANKWKEEKDLKQEEEILFLTDSRLCVVCVSKMNNFLEIQI